MITKTDFLIYLDSPKHLWAHKHGKIEQKKLDVYTQHLLEQGYEVEKYALEYIDKNIKPNAKSVLIQQKLVQNEYEARADVLVEYDDHLDMYEIKSSTKVQSKHEMDATFQYLVFKEQYNIKNVYILHLNPEFVKNGDIDVTELFLTTDITDVVHSRENLVLDLRYRAVEIEKSDNYEEIEGCIRPKTCVCLDICHPNLPDYPIYNMRRLHITKARELERLGVRDITDIPDSFELTDIQQLQVDVAKSHKEYLNEEMVNSELEKLVFPLYFIDYESFNPAIPRFDGYRPYEQITFQYSLHVKETPTSDLVHHEFIYTKDEDPIPYLVPTLQNIIKEKGSIIVWNASFEGTVNSIMGRIRPEYNEFLTDLNNRMFDLMYMFQEQYYANPDSKGSYSIKKVLPIFDSEFSYKDLEIQEGATAMNTWNDIVTGKYSKKEINNLTTSLLQYCKLDTLAMVKIYEGILKKL